MLPGPSLLLLYILRIPCKPRIIIFSDVHVRLENLLYHNVFFTKQSSMVSASGFSPQIYQWKPIKGSNCWIPIPPGYENHTLSPGPAFAIASKPKVTLSPPFPALAKKRPNFRRLLPKNKADDTGSVSSIPRGVPGPPSVRSEDPQSQDPIRGSTEDFSDDPDVPEGPVYKNVAVVGRPVRVDELETYMQDMESRSSGYQNEYVVCVRNQQDGKCHIAWLSKSHS